MKWTKKDQVVEGQELLECQLYLATNDWQLVVTLLLSASISPFKTAIGSAHDRTVGFCSCFSSLPAWRCGIHTQPALKNISDQNQGLVMAHRQNLFLMWSHLKKNAFLLLRYNVYYCQTFVKMQIEIKISIRTSTPSCDHILQINLVRNILIRSQSDNGQQEVGTCAFGNRPGEVKSHLQQVDSLYRTHFLRGSAQHFRRVKALLTFKS